MRTTWLLVALSCFWGRCIRLRRDRNRNSARRLNVATFSAEDLSAHASLRTASQTLYHLANRSAVSPAMDLDQLGTLGQSGKDAVEEVLKGVWGSVNSLVRAMLTDPQGTLLTNLRSFPGCGSASFGTAEELRNFYVLGSAPSGISGVEVLNIAQRALIVRIKIKLAVEYPVGSQPTVRIRPPIFAGNVQSLGFSSQAEDSPAVIVLRFEPMLRTVAMFGALHVYFPTDPRVRLRFGSCKNVVNAFVQTANNLRHPVQRLLVDKYQSAKGAMASVKKSIFGRIQRIREPNARQPDVMAEWGDPAAPEREEALREVESSISIMNVSGMGDVDRSRLTAAQRASLQRFEEMHARWTDEKIEGMLGGSLVLPRSVPNVFDPNLKVLMGGQVRPFGLLIVVNQAQEVTDVWVIDDMPPPPHPKCALGVDIRGKLWILSLTQREVCEFHYFRGGGHAMLSHEDDPHVPISSYVAPQPSKYDVLLVKVGTLRFRNPSTSKAWVQVDCVGEIGGEKLSAAQTTQVKNIYRKDKNTNEVIVPFDQTLYLWVPQSPRGLQCIVTIHRMQKHVVHSKPKENISFRTQVFYDAPATVEDDAVFYGVRQVERDRYVRERNGIQLELIRLTRFDGPLAVKQGKDFGLHDAGIRMLHRGARDHFGQPQNRILKISSADSEMPPGEWLQSAFQAIWPAANAVVNQILTDPEKIVMQRLKAFVSGGAVLQPPRVGVLGARPRVIEPTAMKTTHGFVFKARLELDTGDLAADPCLLTIGPGTSIGIKQLTIHADLILSFEPLLHENPVVAGVKVYLSKIHHLGLTLDPGTFGRLGNGLTRLASLYKGYGVSDEGIADLIRSFLQNLLMPPNFVPLPIADLPTLYAKGLLRQTFLDIGTLRPKRVVRAIVYVGGKFTAYAPQVCWAVGYAFSSIIFLGPDNTQPYIEFHSRTRTKTLKPTQAEPEGYQYVHAAMDVWTKPDQAWVQEETSTRQRIRGAALVEVTVLMDLVVGTHIPRWGSLDDVTVKVTVTWNEKVDPSDKQEVPREYSSVGYANNWSPIRSNLVVNYKRVYLAVGNVDTAKIRLEKNYFFPATETEDKVTINENLVGDTPLRVGRIGDTCRDQGCDIEVKMYAL